MTNIARVEYKYLLTTTYIVDKAFSNQDIMTGSFRSIDLFNKPFGFDEDYVLDRVDDYILGHTLPREMILLEKCNVPLSLMNNA